MIEKFKSLKTGPKRLIFFLSFFVALLIQYMWDSSEFLDFDDQDFWVQLSLGYIVYWVTVLIAFYVKDGFDQDR